MDIENMPDCRLKYQIIVKRANQGMGKFSDSQFKCNDDSIGIERFVGKLKWQRISEVNYHSKYNRKNERYEIFKNGV